MTSLGLFGLANFYNYFYYDIISSLDIILVRCIYTMLYGWNEPAVMHLSCFLNKKWGIPWFAARMLLQHSACIEPSQLLLWHWSPARYRPLCTNPSDSFIPKHSFLATWRRWFSATKPFISVVRPKTQSQMMIMFERLQQWHLVLLYLQPNLKSSRVAKTGFKIWVSSGPLLSLMSASQTWHHTERSAKLTAIQLPVSFQCCRACPLTYRNLLSFS